MSIQLVVILVPVLFAFMGFALDLGRLYLVRGELNQAASTMALAAASQLIGTTASLDNATAAANQSIDANNPLANKYNFGSTPINQTTGELTSTVDAPMYFAAVTDTEGGTGAQADGTTARHVEIRITADAPLLFWSLLSVGQARKTPVAARAVAGVSAPVCTACGIEPFAVAAIDSADTVNFGFGDPTAGTVYTFAYICTGTGRPPALPGTSQILQYAILNRYDAESATLDESQQLYRAGAGGVVSSASPNPTGSTVPIGCVGINDATEVIWASTSPNLCSAAAPVGVMHALCGLYSRFDNAEQPGACLNNVSSFPELSAAYRPDRDVVTGMTNAYSEYTGDGRRIITVAVVQSLATNVVTPMTVLGFRQFLLEPNQDGTYLAPADTNGRFAAQYIGSPAPVKQGYVDDRFALACPVPVPSGPGRVVLHQ
jgi:Flp pilus assembly protein TadG